MAYNALLRNLNHPPEGDSDENMDEDFEEEEAVTEPTSMPDT